MPTTRLVFFNPASGSGWIARRTQRAVDALTAAPGTEAFETAPGSVAQQVRAHLTGEVTRVYAIGGDGTVGDVAAALVGTRAALGIIPCGTTNVLAREFHIPLRTLAAVRALESSDGTARLRAWSVGDHTAVLGAGVGWDARVMWRVSPRLKRRTGRAGVVLIGLREMVRYEFPPLIVTGVDDRGADVVLRGTSVILATVKRWASGNPGIPQADPGDDCLDVVVLESRSRAHLLAFWMLMTLPGGRPLSLPHVRTARLTRARVVCADGRAIEAHVNGEGGLLRTPVALEPAGLVNVILPSRGG